jgi:hypothetical protein
LSAVQRGCYFDDEYSELLEPVVGCEIAEKDVHAFEAV